MEKEFCTYTQALRLKALGFNEPCFSFYQREYAEVIPVMVDDNEQYKLTGFRTCKNSEIPEHYVSAPTFSQAINFLYICSNKQIDIELKASDTYEERLRKIDQGCEDLWNLQNSKSN